MNKGRGIEMLKEVMPMGEEDGMMGMDDLSDSLSADCFLSEPVKDILIFDDLELRSEVSHGLALLPMIIADELETDWKRVRFESAPAADEYKDPVWGMQSTGGSTSIRHMHDTRRKAGAAAREMLISAGSEALKAPVRECVALNGYVRHLKSGKGLTYGKLVFEASRLAVPQNPVLKKESQLKYIGKAIPRLDVPDKSTGKAVFGIDTFVPGMLYATVARPPQYGAEPASFDQTAAEKMKGVKAVVKIPRGIAVCATGGWEGA